MASSSAAHRGHGDRHVGIGADIDEAALAQQPRQLAAELEIDAALGEQRLESGSNPVGDEIVALRVEHRPRLDRHVEVLDQQPAARRERRHHVVDRDVTVSHVGEHEPGVNEVEQAWRRRLTGDVVTANVEIGRTRESSR